MELAAGAAAAAAAVAAAAAGEYKGKKRQTSEHNCSTTLLQDGCKIYVEKKWPQAGVQKKYG